MSGPVVQPRGVDEHFGPGVYARLTGLTISQLRRYDRLGHLLPDEVEESTGRRWYRRSQIPQGRLLGGLIASGMPVAAAARAADDGDGDAVRAHLDAVDAALTAIHSTLPPSRGRPVRWRRLSALPVVVAVEEEPAPDALTAALQARTRLARDLGCSADDLPQHTEGERGFPTGPLVLLELPDLIMGPLPGPAQITGTRLPWDPWGDAQVPDGWCAELVSAGTWALSDLTDGERGADPATLRRVVGEVAGVVAHERTYTWSSMAVAYDAALGTGSLAIACRPLFG